MGRGVRAGGVGLRLRRLRPVVPLALQVVAMEAATTDGARQRLHDAAHGPGKVVPIERATFRLVPTYRARGVGDAAAHSTIEAEEALALAVAAGVSQTAPMVLRWPRLLAEMLFFC